jgi:hypothetical protein
LIQAHAGQLEANMEGMFEARQRGDVGGVGRWKVDEWWRRIPSHTHGRVGRAWWSVSQKNIKIA